jgi:DNA repair protein SbcD/Mre11
MSPRAVRLLLLADTHLGFDRPRRPRVERPRRGEDFFDRYRDALAPALAGEVDAVVHGGDLLFRSRVPASLVVEAMAPLFRVADAGVPVILVPGNHERSRIPFPLLSRHAGVHVLDRPRTVELELAGQGVAFGGFPYRHRMAGGGFRAALAESGLLESRAAIRVLCLHQLVEGARVGVQDFVFRRAPDVIRARDLPAEVAVVLSGHVHRGQLLTRDLAGRPLPSPFAYPGSTERTSFDEREERKGFLRLWLREGARPGGRLEGVRFDELAARPMSLIRLQLPSAGEGELIDRVKRLLAPLAPDAVVHLRLEGPGTPMALARLDRRALGTLAPPGMILTVAPVRRPSTLRPQRSGGSAEITANAGLQEIGAGGGDPRRSSFFPELGSGR